MGKFIEEKQFVVNKIEDFISGVNSYSKYIEGSPTFVTYYHKNEQASLNDIGLGGVIEIVGTESPIKYNKIENFPLYNMEELDHTIEYDDLGLDSDMVGSAIVVPDTIRPLPDDIFVIVHYNKKYNFKVTNVDISNINNKRFYKVDFMISKYDIDILEERQIKDEYKFLYENIGSENKTVVKKSDYDTAEKLSIIFDDLSVQYIENFYLKKVNNFAYNSFYDPYLSYFINKNSIFINKKTFLSNILLDDLVELNLQEKSKYRFSIYNAIETRNRDNFKLNRYNTIQICSPYSPVNIHYRKYSYWYLSLDLNKRCKNFLDLHENIKENNKSKNILENIINTFLNNQLKSNDLISMLENYYIENTIENYQYIPIVFFILRLLKIKHINN